MAVTAQDFRTPPLKPCNAQCVLNLEQQVVFLSGELEKSKGELKALSQKVEAVTIQQASFGGRLDKLPDSVGVASSYMTFVTILIGFLAFISAIAIAYVQHRQSRKDHEIASAVKVGILKKISDDHEVIEAISAAVVISEQQLINIDILVKNRVAQVLGEVRREGGASSPVGDEQVSFSGIEFPSEENK